MKKLLLIPALLVTMAMATEYNWEITPTIGFNLPQDDKILDDSTIFGGELQYNGFASKIKPEFQYLYTEADNVSSVNETDINRFALNGVYNFDKIGEAIPLIKAGVGIEDRQGAQISHPFFDLGLGMKVPYSDKLALKLEAMYIFSNGKGRDDALALLAGLNYSFGKKAQPVAPVVPAPVDGDDDNDGVLNSIDKCPTTAPGKVVNAEGCFVDGDDDNDGVLNASDKCPTTAAGKKVNAEGCFIDEDDDKDGVLNASDICPNTPMGEAVNVDGCPNKITLHAKFDNDSAVVKEESYELIQKYADFLNTYTTYSSKIVGHTSSTGSDSYNLALSLKRAQAIEKMLIEKGVSADRLSANGEGEVNPIADNATKEGRAQNRRIEAQLIKD